MHTLLRTLIICAVSGVAWFSHADETSRARYKDAVSVISLDYCADQYILKLLPPDRIRAVSPDATSEFAYLNKLATNFEQVRPIAEDVIALQPDLVIRTYGGGPNAAHFFEKLGIPVLQIGFANSIDDIKSVIQAVSRQLGVREDGAAVIETMDQRLAALPTVPADKNVLYVTPGGVSGGSDTLIGAMIQAAGLKNFSTEPGWQSLPLEALTVVQPDFLATAFYGDKINHHNYWSASRHPVLRARLGQLKSVALHSATTSCGGWFILDAIETLAHASESAL